MRGCIQNRIFIRVKMACLQFNMLFIGICSCMGLDYTLITLHKDPRTWNDAKSICKEKGERLLDMTNYATYRTLRDTALESPWNGVPVTDMPGAWVDLHKATTIDNAEDIFTGSCERMSELNVIRWGDSNHAYDASDGTGFCVSLQVISRNNDFTMAECWEERRYFCEKILGPCEYEAMPNKRPPSWVTAVLLGVLSLQDCQKECEADTYYNQWMDGGLNVTDICWGYSLSNGICTLYMHWARVGVTYNPQDATDTTTYVRRCFEGAVNDTMFTPSEENLKSHPEPTCGADNSTVTPMHVMWFPGTWTWNEAFQTCQMSGGTMLNNNDQLTKQGLEQFSETTSTTTWWLGLHRPDPQHNMNVQLWSDCEVAQDPNIPDLDIASSDTRLCTVIDAVSLLVQNVKCNERHAFLCVTNTTGSQWNYTAEPPNSKGPGIGSGPFSLNFDACKSQCNVVKNLRQECWGFAHTNGNECILYFTGGPLLSSATSYSDTYTLYRKMLFNYTVHFDPIAPDGDIYPYSCCDVPLLCPTSNVPSVEHNIPTTNATKFILYTSEVSWAVAKNKCQSMGGTLLQIDGVSKYRALRYFIEQWVTAGMNTTFVWTGLFVNNPNQSCSGKWSGSCKSPTWIPGLVNQNERGCYALDSNGLKFQPCNTSHPFVCEVSTGICSINESPGENCQTTEVFEQSSPTTCDSECLTRVKDGKECWATVKSSQSCTLMFSVDPMNCKRNVLFSAVGFTAAYKSCFSSSIDHEVVQDDQNLEPALNCVHPITPNLARCGTTTSSTSSTSTTTSTTTTSTSSSTFSTSTTANTETPSLSTTTLHATDTTESTTIYTNSVMSTAAQNNSVCHCPCACDQNVSSTRNMTTNEWSQWYVANNAVVRNTTSRFIRSKTSAYDDRPSAKSIGIVATCFLGFVAAVIACADIQVVLKALQRWFVNK